NAFCLPGRTGVSRQSISIPAKKRRFFLSLKVCWAHSCKAHRRTDVIWCGQKALAVKAIHGLLLWTAARNPHAFCRRAAESAHAAVLSILEAKAEEDNDV